LIKGSTDTLTTTHWIASSPQLHQISMIAWPSSTPSNFYDNLSS
jgi:hypothetical protein